MRNIPVSGNKSELIVRVIPYLEGLANTITIEANSNDNIIIRDSESN